MRRQVITEVGFDSNVSSQFVSWTDISADVSSIDTNRGRNKDLDTIEAGECTVIVDNADGRYTPGRSYVLAMREDFRTVLAPTTSQFFGDASRWTFGGGGTSRTLSTVADGVQIYAFAVAPGGYVELAMGGGSKAVPVSPGTTIVVKYRAKVAGASDPTPQKLYSQARFEDASGGLILNVDGSTYSAVTDFVSDSSVYTVPAGAAYMRVVIQGYRLNSTTGDLILTVDYAEVQTPAPYAGKIKPRKPIRVRTVIDDNQIHFESVRPVNYDLDKARFFTTGGSVLSALTDGTTGGLVWDLTVPSTGANFQAYVGGNGDTDMIPVKSGQSLRATCQARTTGPATTASILIYFFPAASPAGATLSSGDSGAATSGDTWVQLRKDWTAPGDGFVRMILNGTRTGASGTARFWDLKLSFPSADADYSSYSTDGSSGTYPTFRGFVDTWSVAGNGTESEATVKAVDGLGLYTRPIDSYAREAVKATWNGATKGTADSFAYWPCTQGEDDTQATPLIGSLPLTVIKSSFPPETGGFTADKTFPNQDGTSGGFTQTDDNLAKGAVLSLVNGSVPTLYLGMSPSGGQWFTSFWFKGSSPSVGRSCLFIMADPGGNRIAGLWLNADGTLTAELSGNGDVPDAPFTLPATFNISSGVPAFLAVRILASPVDSTIAMVVTKDSASIGLSVGSPSVPTSPGYVQWGGRIYRGTEADFCRGTINHVGFGTGTNIATASFVAAVRSGAVDLYTSEDNVLGDILDFSGFQGYRRLDAGLSILMPPSWDTNADVNTLLTETAEDGSGTFFFGPDGSAVFHNRARRFTAPSRWGVNEFGQDLTFSLDAQYVYNDVIASRPSGLTREVQDTDSQAEFGVKPKEIRRNVKDPDEMLSAAGWVLHRYRESNPRCDQLVIDASALNGGSADAQIVGLAHGGTLSDKVTLFGLPVTAPADSLAFFIEGVHTNIEVDGSKLSYKVTFYVSDADRSAAFILEDAVFGVLDSDAAVLTY